MNRDIEEDDDFYDPDEGYCWQCGGDGYVDGEDIAQFYDYGWIDINKIYTCPCCGGTGDAKDCTYW